MTPLTTLDLAAVWTPNPAHPYTWAEFFGLLIMLLGCAIAAIGLYAATTTRRGLPPDRRRSQTRPLLLLAAAFLTVGLAIAGLGVWLF